MNKEATAEKGCQVGLLINFHVKHLRAGLRRVINTKK